jgi:hypothetical protein
LDAAEAIGKLPADERLVRDLVERVKDRDAGVRAYSILTLAVLQPRPVYVVPLLVERLDDSNEDEFVRCSAASSLGQFGDDARWAIELVKRAQLTAAMSGQKRLQFSAFCASQVLYGFPGGQRRGLGPAPSDATPRAKGVCLLADTDAEAYQNWASEELQRLGNIEK